MSSQLRRTILANGLFSSISGLVTVVFASGLADFLDVSSAVLYVIGAGVLVFGLMIIAVARMRPSSVGFARFVVVADLLWVLGALVVAAIPGSMNNKWLLLAVSAVVALFAVLQTRGLATSTPSRLATEIEISATPDSVWTELTDLEAFDGWNPFLLEASGNLQVGSRLEVRMVSPGGGDMTFTPMVTSITPGENFEWLGHLLAPGLFDGRHRFDLEATERGTLFRHSEEFAGLLVPLLWKKLDTKTRADFEAMNLALKARVETPVRHST